MVLRAQDYSEAGSSAALETICRTYWFPLYAFVRHSGVSREDAQDLVQEFLADFIAAGTIGRADPEKGKLRTFLLTLLKRFMISQWRKSVTIKRGGREDNLPIDFSAGELRYGSEPVNNVTPETLYDHHWAEELLDRALASLQVDYAERGASERFELLKESLWWNSNATAYRELGSSLGLDVNSVKQAVKRLREQYRRALREEVAATLNSADEPTISAELEELIAILRQRGANNGIT